MCLSCGYYNGRRVMDRTAQKTKRGARIKAKEERIHAERGTQDSAPEVLPERKDSVEKDTHKEAREKNVQTKRPAKRRESKG